VHESSPSKARVIAANLERARLIQPKTSRYVIVDAAGARLWLIEHGRIRDTMRAIVGKKGQETPEMAGLLRFAVLKPYWNLPHDLTRERIAKRVLREGPGFIARERLQILSDWSASARPIGAGQVDWNAVASGRHKLRVRQLPGPGNGMGEMKFMMPNRLGIYLHDTPNKALFAEADRRISSGCVRVEDARRLARWLFGGEVPAPSGSAPEQRVDLPEPVPVYITYLTAVPAEGGGIVFQPDAYKRDAELLAAFERG
jgi:murein L,D-transpeptidase YcbB/YkuD